MTKQFFSVSAGCFLLVAAYQLGTSRAVADWSGSASVVGIGNGYLVWNAAGEAYIPQLNDVWLRQSQYDLPVPATDVRMVDGDGSGEGMLLVTQSDEVWWFYGAWRPMQPVPGGTVSAREQSFGKTKSLHRR